jgi:hypothetical protein
MKKSKQQLRAWRRAERSKRLHREKSDQRRGLVVAFLKERCVINWRQRVARVVLYDAWCFWCKSRKLMPTQRNLFGRDLFIVVPQLRRSDSKQADGSRPQDYIGIALQEDAFDMKRAPTGGPN